MGATGPMFFVHVLSSKSEAAARRDVQKLVKAGYPAGLRQVDLGEKGTWWRVYFGPYGLRPEASQVAEEAKAAKVTDYTQIHRLPVSEVEVGTGRENR